MCIRDRRTATPDEQEVLSRYVGWGGLADAFDPDKPAWTDEYRQLAAILTPQEYEAARASTLNAHYTSPVVIRAMYEAVAQMGFTGGNILEKTLPTLIQPSVSFENGRKWTQISDSFENGRIFAQ